MTNPHDPEKPLAGFDVFRDGVNRNNAFDFIAELAKVIEGLEERFFNPNANDWDRRNGMISLAATMHYALPKIWQGKIKLVSTGTLVGALDSVFHGNRHPLIEPAPRARVAPAHWSIVQARVVTAVRILTNAGMSQSAAHSFVAQEFSKVGIGGNRKDYGNQTSTQLKVRTIKSWCDKARADGPNSGLGLAVHEALESDTTPATGAVTTQADAEVWAKTNASVTATMLSDHGQL